MKQTKQSKDAHQQSKLRFILFEGLLKRGMFVAVFVFIASYLFSPAGFWQRISISIFTGIITGLVLGFLFWHQINKNHK